MKKIFTIASFLFALSHSAEGQNNIVYGAGISYTNGTPTYSPGVRGAQIAIDTVTGYWYEYRTETSAWVHAGHRIQTIAGCVAPGYVPGKKQSILVVNSCDSLYYYRASAWRHLNPPGGGGDPSITNEGILGVSAGGANTSVITSNTSTAVGVTISGSNTILVTESTSANGGTITLQADTSLLATLNDLSVRLIVDTVNDYTALRAYSATAPIVFVRKNGIEGFFKVVTGGWVDDAGITIVGTKKFRRIAENLRIVNVKWFGALGDSTTSDNTAIQAALTWCKDSIGNIGSTLYFPAGRYRYTATINYYKPVNFSIKGDGMHNTYLFPVNVTGIAIRTDSTATLYYGDYGVREGRDLQIHGFTMIRVGSNTFDGKIYGFDLRGGFNKTVKDVAVKNFFATAGTGQGSVGIRLWQPFGTDAVQHCTFDNVYISSCDTGVVSRLQNNLFFRDVKIDGCQRVGLCLSNALIWDGGLCQANQNCGIYLKNSNPSVLNEVTIQGVHFEGNAYVAPRWGGIYKPDNTDMSDLNIHDCLFSSPGGTHMLRLKRVQNSWISNNRWSGNATTDTISLTSFYNVYFGNDNYTSLKLITSDCYVNWLNGSGATVASLVGMTIGTAAAGVNYLSAGGGISVGDTYYSIVAPTDGAIIKGKVGIKNSSPQRDLHVTGETRLTDLTTDPPTLIVGADSDGDLGAITVSTGLSLSAGVLTATGGASGGPDSTWAKSVGGGYANKRITDPVYRSSAIRVNMAGDSAALTLKYASTQTLPILKFQYNNGTQAAIAHVYNSSNPSLIFGNVTSVDAASANNTVFGLTAPTFTTGAGQNTFFGRVAGNSCNGCYENSLFGSSAGTAIIGGFQNVMIGYLAGSSTTTGYQNMFLGRRAGQTNISGQNNVYIGTDAGRLSTGSGNVAIGGQAGDQNTGSTSVFLGFGAGRTNTGSGNVFLGPSAGELTSGSNYLMIDNSNVASPLISGDFSTNKVGINTAPASIVRDLNVTGEARITDLTTDTPTRIVGADADGDLGDIAVSTGLTLSAGNLTADDPSATNEAWTIDADDADTEVISNQTVKFQGAGIAATDYNPTTDVLLITATEVDGSTTNELQTLASTSDATSHTVTLSASGGSIQIVEGTGIGLATTGTGLDGILTITNTATGDPSITNEGILGVSAGGANDALLISNTSTAAGVTYAGSEGVVISESTSANGGTITIAMPSGSTNQTLRYTGSAWAASSEIINDDAAVGIGGNPISGFELYTNGATRTDGAIVTRGTGSNFTAALTTPHVRIWNTTVTTGDTWYLGSEDDGDFSITSGNLGAIEMIIGNTTGYIGLGSVTPTQKLHVTGNARVTGAYYDSNNEPGTSGQFLSTTATGTDWIAGGTGTLTAANNGLYVSGTTVRMGTNPLIEATLIDQDANDMRFYDGKWSYTSWTSSWTPTQGFGIQGTENSPTTATSPTLDGVAEFRVVNSGGSAQPNSLTIGGYATDADGVWIQARSYSNPSFEYPLSAQPRGGQFSVGRLTGLDALVTFSSTGLAGSTAAGSVLHLENVEGNQKAAMSVGVASGTDVVDGEFAYFDATDILRVTNRNTTVGTSALRFAVGGETSDRVTIVESSTTPNARMGVGTTAPISTLQSGGSLAAACVTFTGALTLDERHYRVEYTGTTAITITLPTAANASQRMYVIHHRGTAGTITLSIAINKGNGTTFNTLTAGQHVFIHSDGTTWNGIKLNSL